MWRRDLCHMSWMARQRMWSASERLTIRRTPTIFSTLLRSDDHMWLHMNAHDQILFMNYGTCILSTNVMHECQSTNLWRIRTPKNVPNGWSPQMKRQTSQFCTSVNQIYITHEDCGACCGERTCAITIIAPCDLSHELVRDQNIRILWKLRISDQCENIIRKWIWSTGN